MDEPLLAVARGSDGGLRRIDLQAALTDRMPRSLDNSFLSKVDQPLVQGTGVRAIGPSWAVTQSGLIVPSRMASGPQPIDQFSVFITAEEVFGEPLHPSLTLENIRGRTLRETLAFVANYMAGLNNLQFSHSQLDIDTASQWFKGPARTQVLHRLQADGQVLLAPQPLLTLLNLACFHSPDDLPPGREQGSLPVAYLGICDLLGTATEDVDDDEEEVIHLEVNGLVREIVANQHFNSKIDAAHFVARSVRRWIERSDGSMPKFDLAEEFEAATGVSFNDFLTVGQALWVRSVVHSPQVPLSYFDQLGWPTERMDAVLRLLSLDVPTLRREVLRKHNAQSEWEFSTLSQFPVVRLDSTSLLVVSPSFLLQRVLGWLPLFDVKEALLGRGEGKRWAKVLSEARTAAEEYVLEVAVSMAGAQRVFGSARLVPAFRKAKRRVADIAIDYGSAWVVMEVTSSQLTRDSVAAVSNEALSADLDKLVGEVQQIDHTIQSLREKETALTGAPSPSPVRKYYPVLVLTEGFPVSPVTITILRERAHQAGLLSGSDVGPLEVIDTVELEMVESLQESGGPSLPSLLDMKQSANLHRASLRDYILREANLRPRMSSRVKRLFDQGFEVITRPLREPEGENL